MSNNKREKLYDFMEVILILKEAYMNFDFELIDRNKQPTRRLNLWYSVLGHINNKTLEYVILDYIRNEIYPPQSPAHILNHYKKTYMKLLPNENEVFDYCLDIWRNKARYVMSKTLELLEKDNKYIEAKAFKMIESKLYRGHLTETTENIETWARKDFNEIYKNLLERDIQEKMKTSNLFVLDNNNQLKLGVNNGKET